KKIPSNPTRRSSDIETTQQSSSSTIPISQIREENLISLILKVKPELLKDKRILDLIQTPILKNLLEIFDGNPKNLPKELFTKFGDRKSTRLNSSHQI